MNVIQATIYHALRNIDFEFITAYKNGDLVIVEDMRLLDLRPNVVARKKVLDMVGTDDVDWYIEASINGKMFVAKYYAEKEGDGKCYLVSVVQDDQNKRNDSCVVEYLKNGCKLECYKGTDLTERQFCSINSAKSAIKRFLYGEFWRC